MNNRSVHGRPIFEPAMVRTIDLDQFADMFTPKPVLKTK
jgi:hypothetical protein